VEVTRFAPSPSGPLHLGHALAAMVAWTEAQRGNGRFLLRIDDLDQPRCRAEFEHELKHDLAWLGLAWAEPTRRQSDHLGAYTAALAQLKSLGLVYPCFCTRSGIQREIAAAASAPHGPEGPLYPGTCRTLNESQRARWSDEGRAYAWRLDTRKAGALAGPLDWNDRLHGSHLCTPEILGDVVLARKDIPTSYHLAVVVDDAAQGVTLVTRGEDLLPSTHLHRLLQHLLHLPVPTWLHHPLVRDESGRRLAKRNDARSLRTLRAEGLSPAQILDRLRPWMPQGKPEIRNPKSETNSNER
jgi:glutamyl-Q tRNA(Asp) synthetase